MTTNMIAVRLELIAAKARLLAEDAKNGRFWGGDLSRGLQELQAEITKAQQEARDGERQDW